MNKKRNRRVRLVHLTSAPGGLEVLLPGIITSLPSYDFSVYVIRPPQKDIPDVFELVKVERTYGSENNLVAFCSLVKYAFSNRQDVFHVYNIGPLFLLAIRLAGVKRVVYSIHGTIYWDTVIQMVIKKIIWRLAISDKYIFTANSNYSKQVFLGTVCKDVSRIDVVYNPVFINPMPKLKAEGTGGHLTIGYSGRLVEGKNLYAWMKVAKKISTVYTNAIFCLYGVGKLREALSKYSEELGIADKVTFKGFVRDPAIAFRDSDLMLFLSERESFGNAVVESVLCDTPVIVSDIPSFREVLVNFPQFMVPLDEKVEEVVIEKINHLDNLKGYMPEMKLEFTARFSPAVHLQKISKIYDACTA
jgi:glycosyltransferase involved in cell wall biosynthesis